MIPRKVYSSDNEYESIVLPVLPLRNTVIFPNNTFPILAGRPGTVRAIDRAKEDKEKRIFAVAQIKDEEQVSSDILYSIGTISKISQIHKGEGTYQVLITGIKRAKVEEFFEEDGILYARVKPLPNILPSDKEDLEFIALFRELKNSAFKIVERSGISEVVGRLLAKVNDPVKLVDIVAAHLDIAVSRKQEILETLEVAERIKKTLFEVERLIKILETQEDIQEQIRKKMGERQREILLREQLKAIQAELGEEEEGDELEELRNKLESLGLPAEVKKEVMREFKRLMRSSSDSLEAQTIRTYLETIAELPWNVETDDSFDLEKAKKVLEEDHYGLEDVKEMVLEYLAVRYLQRKRKEESSDKDKGEERAPILLFVGPPGVGKTSIAKSIARAMGRKYVRVSLGGVRDEADIRGHRKTYVGAMPGRIIQGIKLAGSKNPVFLLDEVDKLGISYQGDPASALLEVLDPAQNDKFVDHYLNVPFDLSKVFFIATANFIDQIPAPLLDRMELVEFSGYTDLEKLEIAKRFLIPRQLKQNAIDSEIIEIKDEAILEIINRYTREAGVRELEREITRLARKVARRIAEGKFEGKVVITKDNVADYLGKPRYRRERALEDNKVGVATGMFYTPSGGDILFIEALTMPGKGELILTGKLGEVMKESARAALSYAKAHAKALHISEQEFKQDIHIHVPSGAIPKEGPSAGIAIAVAIVSALSGRPVKSDIAMTGEITLTGRVLPIGGVKEKVLGAYRAGIRHIILPVDNEVDLEDIPEEVKKSVTFHLVSHLGEVLALTLCDVKLEGGKLIFEKGEDDIPPIVDNVNFGMRDQRM